MSPKIPKDDEISCYSEDDQVSVKEAEDGYNRREEEEIDEEEDVEEVESKEALDDSNAKKKRTGMISSKILLYCPFPGRFKFDIMSYMPFI